MCINAGNKINQGIRDKKYTAPVGRLVDESNRTEVMPARYSIEKECSRIVHEINTLKEESEIIHRFEKERLNIENSVRILQQQMEMSIKNIQQNVHRTTMQKTDGEIAQVKTTSNVNTLREEVLSFQRLLKRKEETIDNYVRI